MPSIVTVSLTIVVDRYDIQYSEEVTPLAKKNYIVNDDDIDY